VAAGLDDSDLPVRVHAALTLTEMVSSQDSVKAAVAPQVGKVIQGLTLDSLDVLEFEFIIMQTC
jgi:hypothetical protein